MKEAIQDKLQQGVELMSAQKFELAQKCFSAVLEVDKKNFEAYIHYGNACVNLGETKEAIGAFKKALLVDPQSTSARYSLACAYFLEGAYKDALKNFNKCESLGYATVEMYGLMEVIFLDVKDYTQAIRCANRAIRLNPLHPQPHMDKAQLYLLQGKIAEAVACLREIESILPDAAEPYLLEVELFLQTQEYDRALEAVNRVAERFPEDPTILLKKAKVLNNMGQYEEAKALAENACQFAEGEENPRFKRDVDVQLGIAYAGLNDVDSSIETLARAAATDADNGEALFILLNECYATKRYEEAYEYGQRLLSVEDAEPRFKAAGIFWSASALRELGREEESRSAYGKAVSALRQISIGNPGLIDVYVYRAMSASALGEHEKAIELIDHVIDLTPEDASGYAFKAQILEAKGDREESEKMRNKALAIKPDFEF